MAKQTAILLPSHQRMLGLLGENIHLARKRRGLTTTQVAKRADIGRSTLYWIEKGSPGVALEICCVCLLFEAWRKISNGSPSTMYSGESSPTPNFSYPKGNRPRQRNEPRRSTSSSCVLQRHQWNDPQYSHPVYPVNPCLVPSSVAIQLKGRPILR